MRILGGHRQYETRYVGNIEADVRLSEMGFFAEFAGLAKWCSMGLGSETGA